jgi:uncharacterized DUF497 family protein
MKIRYFVDPATGLPHIFQHDVQQFEVESCLTNRPKVFFWEKGDIPGENLYHALGQLDRGRNLAIFFIRKICGGLLIISARDMSRKDRSRYGKK